MHRRIPLAFLAAFVSIITALPVSQSQAGLTGHGRYAVIIVLDGARPNYLHLVPMPNLEKLIRRGSVYNNAFVGQEIADTPPSHATIGTGDFPKHTGVQGFLWQDPVNHTLFNPTSRAAVSSGSLDRVMATHPIPSIASRVKAADPSARIVSAAGHKCYASDAMGTPRADYILCSLIYHDRWVAAAIPPHIPPPGAINNPRWDVAIPDPNSGFAPAVQQWTLGAEDRWTMNYSLWAFNRIHYPRVLMANLSETDVLGHFASDMGSIRSLMGQFDSLLGRLVASYRRAGILNRTDFVITADHGMARIRNSLPFSVIDDAISRAHATKVFVEHDTGAAIGIRQFGKSHAVAANIMRSGGSMIEATYYKVFHSGNWFYRPAGVQKELPQALRAAYLRLANTMASDSSADVWAVYAPHVSSRQVDAHGYAWVAGHLGPEWGDQHIPLIISGPGVRAGFHSSYPARLVDIAPTLETLLGLPSGGADGRPLADALVHPTRLGLQEQARRARQLQPLVRALRAHWAAAS